jgi:hypothetical protein
MDSPLLYGTKRNPRRSLSIEETDDYSFLFPALQEKDLWQPEPGQLFVVTGGMATGKTTLVRYLAERALRQNTNVALVNTEMSNLGIKQSQGNLFHLNSSADSIKLIKDLEDHLTAFPGLAFIDSLAPYSKDHSLGDTLLEIARETNSIIFAANPLRRSSVNAGTTQMHGSSALVSACELLIETKSIDLSARKILFDIQKSRQGNSASLSVDLPRHLP